MSPTGGIQAMLSIYCALIATGKMISCSSSADVRAKAIGPSIPQFYGTSIEITGNGCYWSALGADGMIGSLGGMPTRDGVEAGGHVWIPEAITPNIEHYERQAPVLYLYRRFLTGNGEGAGRMRGGRGVEVSAMIRGEGLVGRSEIDCNESFVKSQGQWGASPGSRATYRMRRNANAPEHLASGRVPQAIDELDGESPVIIYKSTTTPKLASGDVYSWSSPTTAGWGDPIARLPEAVLGDVVGGHLDAAAAAEAYAVVIRDGAIDHAQTERLRAEVRAGRIGKAPEHRPGSASFGDDAVRVGECLVVSDGHWHCDCGTRLAPSRRNYKDGTLVQEASVQSLGTNYVSDDPDMAERMVFRSFHCPGCATRIDTEIARRIDGIFHDIALER
jgi:N-methylhydantoinase B